MNTNLALLPKPKSAVINKGFYKLQKDICFSSEGQHKDILQKYLEMHFADKGYDVRFNDNSHIQFVLNESLEEESYKLCINTDGIIIGYNSLKGAFYALVTLKHIVKQYKGSVPCAEIQDEPDLKVRGVMIDISRDKIPSMDTLYKTIDMLSDLKFNHLQFYIEGFSFAYPSFKEVWRGETPVTPEEFRALDVYAKERFVDLVPNQNCLGHMAQWLTLKEFNHLAECPQGFEFLGMDSPPATLDPNNDESIELIDRMLDDLLPNFSSSYFNANLDEPFELGKGKNKLLAEQVGSGQIYVDYAERLNSLVNKKGKRLIMTGDSVTIFPELLAQVPKNVLILDWNYEWFTPFEERAQILEKSGLDYILVSGTSTSMSAAGKTDNMFENIKRAASAAVNHKAMGMIVSDWGDGGHWQYAPSSYAGFALAAGLCWHNGSCGEKDVANYLNTFIFEDKSNTMSQLWMDLGNYYHFEDLQMANMTTTIFGLRFGLMPKHIYYSLMDNVARGINAIGEKMLGMKVMPEYVPENRKNYDGDGLCYYLDQLQNSLKYVDMQCGDSELIYHEFENTIRIVRFGAKVRRYIDIQDEMNNENKKLLFVELKSELEILMECHKELWLKRNRAGGLERSLSIFNNLLKQLNNMLQ